MKVVGSSPLRSRRLYSRKKWTKTDNIQEYTPIKKCMFVERIAMLMAIETGPVLEVVSVIVIVALLIRGLLLAGRLVRAVEKIAEKIEKTQ